MLNSNAIAITTDERALREHISTYYADPFGFVCFVFDWGEGDLKDHPEGPDIWQAEQLKEISKQILADPEGYVIRFSSATGHGCGKSSLVAWIIHWFLATRYPTRGVVTANTLRQLTDKTWAELNLWHSRSVIKHWFKWTATKYELIGAAGSSFISAAPNNEHNAEAFQGLHAEHVLIIMDEASGVPTKIWEVCDGAMTTPRAMMMTFGNPTLNTGRFFEVHNTELQKRWTTWQIDSRTAKMTNKEEIDKWIEDHGDDSDFVRVRVKGMFPRQASAQFISGEIIEEAVERTVEHDRHTGAMRVMGVDIARYGDDQNVIAMIEGRKLFPLRKLRNMDAVAVGNWIAMAINDYTPDMVCVDGVGVGGPVVDFLRRMGHDIVEVNAGAAVTSKHKKRLGNRRIEMYWDLKEWLKTADIPKDKELTDDLRSITYTHDQKRMVMILVSKEDMKKQGMMSPDCFVAGTLISTPNGPCKIEDIRAGDEVLTPHGKTPVLRKITSLASTITTVEFSNGTIIQCKPDHAIFTWNRGLIKAQGLSVGDTIEPFGGRLVWLIESLWNTRARSFGFKVMAGTTNRAAKMRRKDFYTEGFGRTLMEQFRRVVISTIKTTIGATTTQITSNAWTEQNTGECTSLKNLKMMRTELTMLRSLERRPSSSTMTRRIVPQKDENECLNRQKNPGKINRSTVNHASFAEKSTRPSFQVDLSTVIRHASKKLTQGQNSKSEVVSIVEKITKFISTVKLRPVVTAVQQSSVGSEDVYDLTLLEDNVYYANGVLVENCSDALAHCFFTSYPQAKQYQSYEPEESEFATF